MQFEGSGSMNFRNFLMVQSQEVCKGKRSHPLILLCKLSILLCKMSVLLCKLKELFAQNLDLLFGRHIRSHVDGCCRVEKV